MKAFQLVTIANSVLLFCSCPVSAFVPTNLATNAIVSYDKTNIPSRHVNAFATWTSSSTNLKMANFDLSKPTFDLFSLKTIRNDALLQYSSLNQSEPLRINLYLILSVALFSFPTLSEAVIGEEAQLTSTAIAFLGGVGSVALFVRECQNRMKQLNRIEKEMNAEFLTIKIPTKNKFDGSVYGNQPTNSLKSLRSNKRVLAICGSSAQLKEILVPLRVFRRRLAQAGALVAVVPNDSEGIIELNDLGISESEIRSCQWVGQAQQTETWVKYFQSLADNDKSQNDLIWFGLNYNGRSFASGIGEAPRLLELLGRNLRPVEMLDQSDEAEQTLGLNEENAAAVNEISQCQRNFYQALTTGDLKEMNALCADNKVQEVTEILDAGGRVDGWESCLAEGARPAYMKTSGSDVLVISPTEAYSTCIEFPADTGGYSDPFGATLLAMQRWIRKDESEGWELEFHQTIPWSSDTKAGGTLRCDSRGCVALTRGREKKTFGGLIG